MQSDGRIESRAMVTIPVHLVPLENVFGAETTTLINISRRGARVITGRRWRQGEQLGLASMSGEFRRQATVVYCHPSTEGQFCVGLEFDGNMKNWKDATWASVA
jgi:PilZ domain